MRLVIPVLHMQGDTNIRATMHRAEAALISLGGDQATRRTETHAAFWGSRLIDVSMELR